MRRFILTVFLVQLSASSSVDEELAPAGLLVSERLLLLEAMAEDVSCDLTAVSSRIRTLIPSSTISIEDLDRLRIRYCVGRRALTSSQRRETRKRDSY
jgi:hypothetical protein